MIIWITGRIAAGKWVVVEYLKEKWFEYFTVSQMVRQEAKKRGGEITRYNLQNIGNEVRQEFGAWEWIKRILAKMEVWKNYIIDGIRNPWEIQELRHQKDFFLFSIDALQNIRFERVLLRGKDSDPTIWEKFLEIDQRDFWEWEPDDGQQVGKCMEEADFQFLNNDTKEEYISSIESIYNSIKK